VDDYPLFAPTKQSPLGRRFLHLKSRQKQFRGKVVTLCQVSMGWADLRVEVAAGWFWSQTKNVAETTVKPVNQLRSFVMTKFLMTIAAIAVTTLALGTEVQAKGHGGRRGGHSEHQMGRGHGHSRFHNKGFDRGRRDNRWDRYGWYRGHRNYWWRYNRYTYYRPYFTNYGCTTCSEVEPQVAETTAPCTTCQECQTTSQECPTTCDEGGIGYRRGYGYRYGYRGKYAGRGPIRIRPLDRGGRLRSGMKNSGKGSGGKGGKR
jgi:hypothetical protein